MQTCSNAPLGHGSLAQLCAAQGVLDAGADGDVRSWCEELDNFREAIAHKSILWLTLMACAQVASLTEPPTDALSGFSTKVQTREDAATRPNTAGSVRFNQLV